MLVVNRYTSRHRCQGHIKLLWISITGRQAACMPLHMRLCTWCCHSLSCGPVNASSMSAQTHVGTDPFGHRPIWAHIWRCSQLDCTHCDVVLGRGTHDKHASLMQVDRHNLEGKHTGTVPETLHAEPGAFKGKTHTPKISCHGSWCLSYRQGHNSDADVYQMAGSHSPRQKNKDSPMNMKLLETLSNSSAPLALAWPTMLL